MEYIIWFIDDLKSSFWRPLLIILIKLGAVAHNIFFFSFGRKYFSLKNNSTRLKKNKNIREWHAYYTHHTLIQKPHANLI